MTIETMIIDVIGMYTRVFGRSMRISPGSRPNHDSSPVDASNPAITRMMPATIRSVPKLDRISLRQVYLPGYAKPDRQERRS